MNADKNKQTTMKLEGNEMSNGMKFEKRNFMGIELDVLVGHPEFELLFVATQVARAVGLKAPSVSVAKARERLGIGRQLHEAADLNVNQRLVLPSLRAKNGTLRRDAVMLTESECYRMLMRGHAPQSEPFRQWVTEEVLPAIRKTGSYNAKESTNPIAVGVMDELKTLRLEVSKLTEMVSKLSLSPVQQEVLPSPYEGTGTYTTHRFISRQMLREQAEVISLT